MKNPIFYAIAWCFLLINTAQALAQGKCEGFYPLEKGVHWKQSHYDAKGKLSSTNANTIAQVTATADGFDALVSTLVADSKGKEIGSGEFTAKCVDGEVILDVNQMLLPGLGASYLNMDMSVSGDGLRLPNQLSVGQELPGGNTSMVVELNGLRVANMSFEVTERKVEAKETVDTPIGPHECFRIKERVDYRSGYGGGRVYTTLSWYAKGKGLLRQETYDDKGKLSSRMEVTEWKKL